MFAVQYENASPDCKSLLDVLRFIEPYCACYSQLHTAYQIACTIPVTRAENERSFSCLKKVKTYLRSSFSNSLLSVDAYLTIDADLKVRGLYNECQIPLSLSVNNDIRQLSVSLDEIMDHTPDKIEFCPEIFAALIKSQSLSVLVELTVKN